MVELGSVEDQEPVVEGGDRLYGQGRVLLVEFGDGRGREELRDAFLKRGDRHVRAAALLGKDVERRVVAVVVDEDDALRRLAHELPRKGEGVVVLPVEENLLRREVAAVHRFEDRFKTLLVSGLVCDLPSLHDIKAREERRHGRKRLAHGDEGSYDYQASLRRLFAPKNARQHDNPVFCEGIGAIFDILPPSLVQGHKL